MDIVIEVLKSDEEEWGRKFKKGHSQQCPGSWFLLVSPSFE
jgi:hypothetical protein